MRTASRELKRFFSRQTAYRPFTRSRAAPIYQTTRTHSRGKVAADTVRAKKAGITFNTRLGNPTTTLRKKWNAAIGRRRRSSADLVGNGCNFFGG
jgi:O-acetylhomoserine/O-acetylserine sulfhydrylase-like pyridoxal-dependent enzyme